MQIVIDVPDKVYEMVMNTGTYGLYLFNSTRAIRKGIPLDKIRAEIAEYKDDKVIHAERNEMIDIVLAIIDRHINGKEKE